MNIDSLFELSHDEKRDRVAAALQTKLDELSRYEADFASATGQLRSDIATLEAKRDELNPTTPVDVPVEVVSDTNEVNV